MIIVEIRHETYYLLVVCISGTGCNVAVLNWLSISGQVNYWGLYVTHFAFRILVDWFCVCVMCDGIMEWDVKNSSQLVWVRSVLKLRWKQGTDLYQFFFNMHIFQIYHCQRVLYHEITGGRKQHYWKMGTDVYPFFNNADYGHQLFHDKARVEDDIFEIYAYLKKWYRSVPGFLRSFSTERTRTSWERTRTRW